MSFVDTRRVEVETDENPGCGVISVIAGVQPPGVPVCYQASGDGVRLPASCVGLRCSYSCAYTCLNATIERIESRCVFYVTVQFVGTPVRELFGNAALCYASAVGPRLGTPRPSARSHCPRWLEWRGAIFTPIDPLIHITCLSPAGLREGLSVFTFVDGSDWLTVFQKQASGLALLAPLATECTADQV